MKVTPLLTLTIATGLALVACDRKAEPVGEGTTPEPTVTATPYDASSPSLSTTPESATTPAQSPGVSSSTPMSDARSVGEKVEDATHDAAEKLERAGEDASSALDRAAKKAAEGLKEAGERIEGQQTPPAATTTPDNQ